MWSYHNFCIGWSGLSRDVSSIWPVRQNCQGLQTSSKVHMGSNNGFLPKRTELPEQLICHCSCGTYRWLGPDMKGRSIAPDSTQSLTSKKRPLQFRKTYARTILGIGRDCSRRPAQLLEQCRSLHSNFAQSGTSKKCRCIIFSQIDGPNAINRVLHPFNHASYLEDRYFHSTVKNALCKMFVNTRVLRPRKKMPLMPSSPSEM